MDRASEDKAVRLLRLLGKFRDDAPKDARSLFSASAAADAPIEITVAMNGTPTGWPASEDENFIQQQILEKTGVRFVMSPLDNYAQTLNLLVANDDAPDMFIVNADTMRTYAAQDMLLDLTPYKETGL